MTKRPKRKTAHRERTGLTMTCVLCGEPSNYPAPPEESACHDCDLKLAAIAKCPHCNTAMAWTKDDGLREFTVEEITHLPEELLEIPGVGIYYGGKVLRKRGTN
jgi:hypothetical protein